MQTLLIVLFALTLLALCAFALPYQKKKFLSFLQSENIRIDVMIKQAVDKAYKKGASDMADAVKKQMDEAKRVATSVPFVVATGNEVENKQRLSIAGMHWDHYKDNRVPLLFEHDWTKVPLGYAYPYIDDGVLKAVINFREGLENIDLYGDMYPSIGGTPEEKVEGEDGITVTTKFSLHAISLHRMPNQDPTIKTLNQQIKNK